MIYYLLSEKVYIYRNGNVSVRMGMCLRGFEAWAKLAQQWVLCVPLETHLKPINKDLMLLVTIIIIIINCMCHLAQKENCAVPNKKLFGPMMCHMKLSKTLMCLLEWYMYVHVY